MTIIDTSVCVDLLREQATRTTGPATRKLVALGETRIHLSVFTVCELEAATATSSNPQRERQRIELLTANRSVIAPNERFARLYGDAKAALRKAGSPIPIMDLLIGVCALQSGEPLLTRDPVHSRKILGLAVQTY